LGIEVPSKFQQLLPPHATTGVVSIVVTAAMPTIKARTVRAKTSNLGMDFIGVQQLLLPHAATGVVLIVVTVATPTIKARPVRANTTTLAPETPL
jgi:hypothetical protein